MEKTVYCPVCHQRLFDVGQPSRGQIMIKCPRCRQIQQIDLYSLKSEQDESIRQMTTQQRNQERFTDYQIAGGILCTDSTEGVSYFYLKIGERGIYGLLY